MGERQLDKLEVTGSSPVAPMPCFPRHRCGIRFISIGGRIGLGAGNSAASAHWCPMDARYERRLTLPLAVSAGLPVDRSGRGRAARVVAADPELPVREFEQFLAHSAPGVTARIVPPGDSLLLDETI